MKAQTKSHPNSKGLSLIYLALIGFFSLILSCSGDDAPQNTFNGDALLNSSEQLQEFAEKGYTKVSGDLIIGSQYNSTDNWPNSPEEILNVDSIMGNLLIANTRGLSHLKVLGNLVYVGGKLEVADNSSLSSLNGLEKLMHIGADLNIGSNALLQSIEGLLNVQGEVKELNISKNHLLQSLNGLEGIEKCETLTISENSGLNSLEGLEGLRFVTSEVAIRSNKNLKNLQGLNHLRSMPGDVDAFTLSISDNQGLASLEGLDHLNRLYALNLDDLSSIQNLTGLESRLSIDTELKLRKLANIRSLRGLNTQISVPVIRITLNNALVDIGNLRGVNALNILQINGNESLKNLAGLENLESINQVLINTNRSLGDYCALTNLMINHRGLQSYAVVNNLFNPSISDFSNGNCSL